MANNYKSETVLPWSRLLLLAAILLLVAQNHTWAFVNLHDASYHANPEKLLAPQTALHVAGIIDGEGNGHLTIPVAFSLALNRHWELGAGVRSQWIDVENHLPHAQFGLRYSAAGSILEADLWLGLDESENGLALSYGIAQSMSSRFALYYQAKIGFMPQFVYNDALLGFELSATPAFRVGRSLQIVWGFDLGSQSNDFEKFLAIDMEPGLWIPLGSDGRLALSVALGLAGNFKEDVRFRLAWMKPF